jgi:D-sedoheptulose 7-phosphate isomerase
MRDRNVASRVFVTREAERLADLSRRMSERFERGGRLLAFGRGHSATDAQHIAVEFVHPVLAGKRALPALDLSTGFREAVPVLVRADDIAVGFGPPAGDAEIDLAVRDAMSRGALAIALPGTIGDYTIASPSADPFIHQEIIEVLYHTLWETVHVFFERRPIGGDAGPASFLYPFLGNAPQESETIMPEVAASIRSKFACVERLREQVVVEQGGAIAAAVGALHARVAVGGTVFCFGNGGSATDATDFASDLVDSPKGYAAVPAISLAAEPATITALANDIGSDAIFLRQIIAYGRPGDVAVAISTSGGSSNIIAALIEARARGLVTVALLGYDGGDVLRRQLADHVIVVRSDQIPRVQEVHASIYHVMTDMLDIVRAGR